MKYLSLIQLQQLLLLIVFCGVFSCGEAPSKRLPNDVEVLTGRLANGLQYYIRSNREPQQQAYLQLVTRVGSLVEEEAERGFAHFTEHMAFKGTRNFPGNSLIDTLQKSGVRFGTDLNAYTGLDQTVYQLAIPLADTNLMVLGLQVLRDWAGDFLMETEAIESERGVILEEMRQRKGLQERIREQTLPILLNQSRHVDRMPIGTETVLRNFLPEDLRKFYQKWYRPDLQALVIVGDFDAKRMEQHIRSQFSDIRADGETPVLPEASIKLNGATTFSSVVDEEIRSPSLQLINKFPATLIREERDLHRQLRVQLFNDMIGKRLAQLQRQAEAPLLAASAGIAPLFDGLEGAAINVSFVPENVEQGVKAVMAELQRVKQFGFTEAEFERAKTTLVEMQNHRYNQRDKITSEAYGKQYVQAFLHDTPFPSEHTLNKIIREQLAEISLKGVNGLIDLFFETNDRDLLFLMPEGAQEQVPSEADLERWLTDVAKSKLDPYKDMASSTTLPGPIGAPGRVVSAERITSPAMAKWVLSNGATVLLYPTTLHEDQVLLAGISQGGSSLYEGSDYDAAMFAVPIVSQSGVADFDVQMLSQTLTGKVVQFQPYIQEDGEGFSAASNKRDIETCLQLIHLYFTQARLDESAASALLRKTKLEVEQNRQLPAQQFMDAVYAKVYGGHWSKQPMNAERIDAVKPERAVEIFRERFANAGDFTFVLTGSLDTIALRPLIEKYIGGIPGGGPKEQSGDLGIRHNEGAVSLIVDREIEHKATVQLAVQGGYSGSPWDNVRLNFLTSVLQYRIMEHLRQQESGTYAPTVNVQKRAFPKPRYSISIGFTCDPAKREALVAVVKGVLAQLVKDGPSTEEIHKILAETRAGMSNAAQTNSYWHTMIISTVQQQLNLEEINNVERYLNTVTTAHLHDAAKIFLGNRSLQEFYLIPRK